MIKFSQVKFLQAVMRSNVLLVKSSDCTLSEETCLLWMLLVTKKLHNRLVRVY